MELLLDRVSKYEDKALEIGDLKSAIKLNWLKNTIKSDGLDYDSAVHNLLCITMAGKFQVDVED